MTPPRHGVSRPGPPRRTVPRTLRAVRTGAALGVAAVTAGQVAPGALWLPPVRRVLAPALSGLGSADHLALTFDDGPDPASTPAFLDALADHGVHATFFCVGEMAARAPDLVREIAAAGHEVGVHGWHHINQLSHPSPVGAQLRHARDLLGDLLGRPPRWYRPPYGVLSGQGLLATRRLSLQVVLWSVWGKDWLAGTTPAAIYARLAPGLVGGATVLLHDTDAYSSPGSWRATLAVLPQVVATARALGLGIGTLGQHGIGGYSGPTRRYRPGY